MGDIAALLSGPRPMVADTEISIEEWASYYGMGQFPFGALNLGGTTNVERVEETFAGLVYGGYRGNGTVFACAMSRFLIFSQPRIVFQQLRGGLEGDLFGTPDLSIIEQPWHGATTADLLGIMDLDAQFAGMGWAVRRPDRIERLRPDWVGMVIGNRVDGGNPWDPDAEFLGITYSPNGITDEEPMTFTRDEVMYYAPIRDPLFRLRGMSWLRPVIIEIMGDTAAMKHKQSFFEHGATPALVVKSDIRDKKKWREWVQLFSEAHEGTTNGYKTLHLQAGADATAIGMNLRQLDFKVTQGHGESRIAAASGMHPVVVALSEGLAGASLNAGNFRAAAKSVADTKLRPLWNSFMGSATTILPPPAGSRVWYDDKHVPFLAEDRKDSAEALNRDMLSIESGIRGGFVPSTVVDSVTSGDLRRLRHTGLFSVQLQPPGSGQPPEATSPPPGAMALQLFAEFAGNPLETGLPKLVGERVAVSDFTPISGLLTEFGTVTRGTVLPADSPHVAAFPSMFGIADAEATLARRVRELREQGLTVPAIAARLERTERHVRRLMGGGAQSQ